MKRHILSLAPVLAMVASAANAQTSDTATGDVGVYGNVARLCILGAPSPATVDVGQMAATSGPRVGKIAPIGVQNVSLPGSFCNFAGSHLTVSATALVSGDTTAVQPGFAKAVNYTATASNWSSAPTSVTTAAAASGASPTATSSGSDQPLPNIADLNVALSDFQAPSDLLLTAGSYSGLVVVTLGPAAIQGDK